MSVSTQIKDLIKSREAGDKSAQSKIDALMNDLPKVDTSAKDHEIAQFHAERY